MQGQRKYRGNSKSVSVSDFFGAGQDALGLEIVSGQDEMGRTISEPAMNRPGLALSGFLQYFAHRRVQVLGHAENAYLLSLDEATRVERIRKMLECRVPCVVITRNRKIISGITELANESRTPVLKSGMITGDFVNRATIIMEDLQTPVMKIQGTMMDILGVGVLIMGAPGIGKSETAMALLRRGHSLVSDDLTDLKMDSSGVVIASCPTGIRYHMELHGLGIIHVPSIFGVASVRGRKTLDLVIKLARAETLRDAGPDDPNAVVAMLGSSVTCVTIPVAPGRDIAGLVEIAALDQKLKKLGHDAAKELDEKLIKRMSEGRD